MLPTTEQTVVTEAYLDDRITTTDHTTKVHPHILGTSYFLDCGSVSLHFYKFSRWPGVLCFISRPDRTKLLKELKLLLKRDHEDAHSIKMYEGLVRANVAGTGLLEEVVREWMAPTNPNN